METCCDDATNRRVVAKTKDCVTEKCQACGRKHITLLAQPIVVGLKF